jgi:hypothetical protein
MFLCLSSSWRSRPALQYGAAYGRLVTMARLHVRSVFRL